MDYRGSRENFEVPYQVTQAGISKAIRIQQKHLPRALKKLKGDSMLEEKMMHVTGVKQKRKVYFLTQKGTQYAWEFINNLMKKDIPIVSSSDTTEDLKSPDQTMILEELYNHEKSDFSLLDLLLFLDETGYFDKDALQNQLERLSVGGGLNGKSESDSAKVESIKKQTSELIPAADKIPVPEESIKISPSARREIYYTALKQAWQDGQITKDEQDILNQLQKKLGISAEEHKKIEIQIMTEDSSIKPDSGRIYKAALKQAWVDGVISEDEESLLKELRRTLKISEEQHKKFEEELKVGKSNR